MKIFWENVPIMYEGKKFSFIHFLERSIKLGTTTMTTGCVYVIKNMINDKVYVGVTTCGVANRFRQHINSSKREDDGCAIHRAMRKYGGDQFYYEILEDNVEISHLGEREREYISVLNSLVPNGYNIRKGGNDSGARPVFQIAPFTGEIVCEYPSLTAAAIALNTDLSQLSKVCRSNSSCKSSAGYLWCFVEDYNQQVLANMRPHFENRALFQIEEGSCKILHRWNSVRDACQNTGVNQPSLSACLSEQNRTANGFCWCYCDQYKDFTKKSSTRFVLQIDKTTREVVGEYKSAKDASVSLCGNTQYASFIQQVCNPNCNQRTAYGYIWRYKDVHEKTCKHSNNIEN